MRIKLHKGQSEVFKAIFLARLQRHYVTVCARGWGKTYLAATAATKAVKELCSMRTRVPNKDVRIICPTFDQAIDIYYPILAYDMGMLPYSKGERTGRFKFANNTRLTLTSYESVERMRGKGTYFAVNDEPSSWTKGMGFQKAWEDIIEPTIMSRWSPMRARQVGVTSAGKSLTIGTPNGYNFLYDMYNFGSTDPTWKNFHYDYTTSPYLDPAEIELLKHRIDPLTFAREYLASFEESGANVFYCFSRDKHILPDVPYFKITDEHKEDVHVCIDFNVGVQASSMFALRSKKMYFLDETQGLPNTEELANYLVQKFPGHRIIAYPDPTGNSRKTSATIGVTDFAILKDKGIRVCARSASPPIIDSVNAVNSRLLTQAGDISMFFCAKRCKRTIKSLERTSWLENNPNLAVIDKSEGVEHFSDGVRYATEYLFPVRFNRVIVSRQTNDF